MGDATLLAQAVPALPPVPKMRWMMPNTRGTKPVARYFHGMCVVGDAVVVVGGKDDHTRFSDVHVFNKDPRKALWTQPTIRGVMPKPRSAHSLNVVGLNIFMFGGHRDREKFNDVFVLDTSTMSWVAPRVQGTIPAKRNAHTTNSVGTDLFVFGGFRGESCSDLYVFDTVTYTWSEPQQHGTIPPARCCHTMTLIDEDMWLFGGKNNDSSGVVGRYNDLYSLNTKTLKWESPKTRGVPPSKRNAHSACQYKKNLLIFGGFDGDSCNDLYIFDTQTMVWQEVILRSTPPAARYCHGAASYVVNEEEDKWAMIVFGGCDSDANFSDIQILEIEGAAKEKDDKSTVKLKKEIQQMKEENAKLRTYVKERDDTIKNLEAQVRRRSREQSTREGPEMGVLPVGAPASPLASDEDDEGERKERKKKKKKKKKKKRNDDDESDEEGNVRSNRMKFDDGEGAGGMGGRIERRGSQGGRQGFTRPPAHLAPLNLGKFGQGDAMMGGQTAGSPPLFPPLKA
eukprot:TRINITY_DN1649_c3_g1_i1.p1 TRINITY_DN1649_c3_g1~~TRINITY_DN1649_c3_g1_i1.p1  ORF type:complete len:511 (+),score=163.54 TRINITY_DN1649_c3_g1_i1:182-1714(+)